MPAEYALELFRDIGQPESRSLVIQAVEHEIGALEERAAATGTEFRESYAAVAVEMALQLEHPFNSATSKSMCAKALNETMDKLHALAPTEQSGDGVDELQKKRDTRRQAAAVAQ
jgi:argininosuccinate synthase